MEKVSFESGVDLRWSDARWWWWTKVANVWTLCAT